VHLKKIALRSLAFEIALLLMALMHNYRMKRCFYPCLWFSRWAESPLGASLMGKGANKTKGEIGGKTTQRG